MSFIPGLVRGSQRYLIDNSLMFPGLSSNSLSRTPTVQGDADTWTFSAWVKKNNNGSTPHGGLFDAYVDGANFTSFHFYNGKIYGYSIIGATDYGFEAYANLDDPASHFHVVIRWDTNEAASTDRWKVYINGVRLSLNWIYGAPTSGYLGYINGLCNHNIGHRQDGNYGLNGYMSEVHHVDGQSLGPEAFGKVDSVTGQWVPIKPVISSYGTNGFRLEFSKNDVASDLGIDTAEIELGQDLTADPSFDNPAAWTGLGVGDSVSGGKLNLAPRAGWNGIIETPYNGYCEVGEVYRVAVFITPEDLVTMSSGIVLACGGATFPTVANLGWNYSFGTAVSAAPLELWPHLAFEGSVGAVKVQKVLSGYTGNGILSTQELTSPGDLTDAAWIKAVGATTDVDTVFSPTGSDYVYQVLPILTAGSKRTLQVNVTCDGICRIDMNTSNGATIYTTTGAGTFDIDLTDEVVATETFAYLRLCVSSPLCTELTLNSEPIVQTFSPGNNFSVNGIGTANQSVDTPTNNYCTWNPLARRRTITTPVAFSEGMLKAAHPSLGGTVTYGIGTIIPESGKYYWEIEILNASAGYLVGVATHAHIALVASQSGTYYSATGALAKNGGTQSTGATFIAGDIIGVAYSKDDLTVEFFKNGVSQGTVTGLTDYLYGAYIQGTDPCSCVANFGQRAFTYTPPTGFESLCAENLPVPDIKQPADYFDVLTYLGDGTTDHDITGLDFTPDLVWIKNRDTTENHTINDSVRGDDNSLYPNLTNAETSGTDYLDLISGGLKLKTTNQNVNAQNYVAWCLKEGVIPGFDMVEYVGTGAALSVAHSLGVKPELIITKNREGAYNWLTGFDLLGYGNVLSLNLTDAAAASATVFDTPDASVFKVKTSVAVNQSTKNHIAYLFASIPGFSKVFSYTGNGSTDGTFVSLGFKPRFIMVKRTDAIENWFILDTQRDVSNPGDSYLLPNSSGAEAATNLVDFVSNGFKCLASGSALNASGGTYVGIAFAESPFKYATAR